MKKQWTVGKRIGMGFGLVLTALALAAGWSIYGFNGVARNLDSAVECNVLRGEIAQREIDHLKWAAKVNDLLTDESVTTLDVQTNPRECAFGKWYYGEGRQTACKLVPECEHALAAIEDPHRRLHESAVSIGEIFQPADAQLPAFLAEKENDHLKWANACLMLFTENRPELDVQTDHHRCGLGEFLYGDAAHKAAADPEMARLIEALKTPHEQLHQSALAIQQVWKPIHPGLQHTLLARLDDHRRWAAKVSQACLTEAARLEVETNADQCAFGRFLHSEQCAQWCATFPALKSALEACQEPHEQLHATAVEIGRALAEGDVAGAKRIYAERTVPALEEVAGHFSAAIAAETELVEAQAQARQVFDERTLPALEATRTALSGLRGRAVATLGSMKQAGAIFASDTKPALHEVQALLGQIGDAALTAADAQNTNIQDVAQTSRMAVGAVCLGSIILGILIAFLVQRGIVKILKRIVGELNEGADQVNDASAQVSSTAQMLAEGSSEQAASLEETSSALEEMAAMTRTNAANAKEANELGDQARRAAQDCDQTTDQLNHSMSAINEAAGQIGKIIKVIEEIAFQTNLLALNAAVEAARAGEHGKGFAVVADEVRNLAQRAAQASGEITTLIEDSANKTREGTQVADAVGKSLTAIVGDVARVTELINGIARASDEQAQGVDQINTAVSEMDKVTQQNAAGAEESASAAEELSAQAATVKGMVDELAALVSGDRQGVSSAPSAPAKRYKAPKPSPARVGAGKRPAQANGGQRSAAPKQVTADDEFLFADDGKGLDEF